MDGVDQGLSSIITKMQRALELEECYGVTGYINEEPAIGAGDFARMEHLIHELCHGALLFPGGFEGERHLSETIPNALSEMMGGEFDPITGPAAHENELETFAVEALVMKQLRMPVHLADIEAALAIQVANVLPDFIRRFREAQDTAHIQLAADQVAAMLAPDGPEERPSYAKGVVFWRRVRSGDLLIVYPMLLGNARLCQCQDDDFGTMFDAWCYQSDKKGHGLHKAIFGAAEWDGEGDDPPGGWNRNPLTGRRRPGGDPEQEFKAW